MTTVVVVAAEADGPASAKPANANPAIVRTVTPPTALRRARSKWRMPHIRSEGRNGLFPSPHEAHSKQDDARRREVFGRRERPARTRALIRILQVSEAPPAGLEPAAVRLEGGCSIR